MASAPRPKQPEIRYTEEMRDLLQRAQDGDASVLAELREFLDGHPELWRQFGDMAGHARDALLALASGKSLLARESIKRRMGEIQTALAGPAPCALTELLVERVGLCWLQSYLADLDAVQKERADTVQASHAQRRQSAAQARYLAAIKQLALVRKLVKPSPTTLDLLRKPVDETSGATGTRSSRFTRAQEVVEMS